jgi:hypothetical protein
MAVAGSNPEIPLAGNKRKRRKKDSREGEIENPLELFAKVERSWAETTSSHSTLAEVEVATVIGTYREKLSSERGYRDNSRIEKDESLAQNIDAAGAELAASKLTNCRWNMTTGDNLAEPDLWPHVEVRHTTHDAGGLIVRAKDKPGRLFVLVVGTLPRYCVVGWKRIDEARCDGYRWNDVWKVPQSGLTPL